MVMLGLMVVMVKHVFRLLTNNAKTVDQMTHLLRFSMQKLKVYNLYLF